MAPHPALRLLPPYPAPSPSPLPPHLDPLLYPALPPPSGSVSFLTHPSPARHPSCNPEPTFATRRREYEAGLGAKRGLVRVCRVWASVGVEVVFEYVWIGSAREGRGVAERLGVQRLDNPGKFIRRLHIETPSMERCSPHDLLLILQHCPLLEIFEDYNSVRRPQHPLALSLSPIVPFSFTSGINPSSSSSSSSCPDPEYPGEITIPGLTHLEAKLLSDTTLSLLPDPSEPAFYTLTLPSLRALKITLDNPTFAVLSTWSLPALTHLSVVSADFSYAGPGFRAFFERHGGGVRQLELGHSTGEIEEVWVVGGPGEAYQIPLAAWTPLLTEFIVSADAEWNWHTPDWIAPHVLLPAHPSLEFIGVRDMEKRIGDDLEAAEGRRRGRREREEDPLWALENQMGSLLDRTAFPNLRYIRDMSWGSDLVRRTGMVGGGAFWRRVVERCREGGVWLEDCRGLM
ncbi:hypothetical protein B0H34DRAFT_669518 [Crassisporium funariophilum]|nr:hypothetical protein B0H34DRAFT_669518 [Crassisporium funariophilum]